MEYPSQLPGEQGMLRDFECYGVTLDPVDPSDDVRERLLTLFAEHGFSKGENPHSWRCQYPDRYPDYCDCAEGLADALIAAGIGDVAAERARADRYETWARGHMAVRDALQARIKAALEIGRSSSVPLGMTEARHFDRIIATMRAALTEEADQ